MGKPSTDKNGYSQVAKIFGGLLPAFDVETMAGIQRKNLEAMTKANQLAVEGIRALTLRQSEIMQRALEEASGLWRDLLVPSSPEGMLVKQTGAAKQAFEQSVATVRELRELSAKATTDVFSVLAKRVSESFDNVRLFAKK